MSSMAFSSLTRLDVFLDVQSFPDRDPQGLMIVRYLYCGESNVILVISCSVPGKGVVYLPRTRHTLDPIHSIEYNITVFRRIILQRVHFSSLVIVLVTKSTRRQVQ
jgi:hypothetical protein